MFKRMGACLIGLFFAVLPVSGQWINDHLADHVGEITRAVELVQRATLRAQLDQQYQAARQSIVSQVFDIASFDSKLRVAYIDATEKELREGLIVIGNGERATWQPPEGFFRRVAEKKIAATWDREDMKRQREQHRVAAVAAFEESRNAALASLEAQYQAELQKIP